MSNHIAIFASGSGVNTETICNYFIDSSEIDVVLILSNNPNAFVLNRAKKFHIDTFIFKKSVFKNYLAIKDLFKKHKIDFIILAGFLLKIPNKMIKDYSDKIINIHPALLPKYGGKGMYGKHVHKAVIENKETISGITIHYVNNKYDDGKIIFQAKCNVKKNDTPESLANKINTLEYEYFPKIIASIIKNQNK
tara:strand:- start:903 stop:1481 length:579 start_codon:yes stop_codon:yes gene_type:complete